MYNVVVTRARNEHVYLKNFIDHYLNIGFDFIYIFIESDQNYDIKNQKIKFIKHDYKGNEVIPLMFNTFTKEEDYKNKIDWILHVDVDEFLFLKDNINISEYISKFYKENIGQFIFKWAMIENYRSIDSENDFQNIMDQSNLYSNHHYKSMVKLEHGEHQPVATSAHNPHFANIKNDTYLDNIKIEDVKGHTQIYNNYSNAILVHYHTRNLEDVFIKMLATNLRHKKINPDILKQNYSTSELVTPPRTCKLRLPFAHARGVKIDKKSISYVKFNTETKINNKIIHHKLQNVCKENNIDYNIVIKYIKDLELQYSKHFLCY